MPRTEERRVVLPVAGDRRTRLVVVADTHGRPHERSAERIRAEDPDAILHAGDIGDPKVLDELERIAPTLAVRGNIDFGRAMGRPVPDQLTIEVGALLCLLLLHIAVDGPRLRKDARRQAEKNGAALVVCGHSHVPFIGTDGGIAVFNPGSIGPRRFRLPILFGVIDVDGSAVRMRHVDCETGRAWAPGASQA
jgi:hypothetical protein